MVFTKLSVQEKDAFFGLLDEYFQSRPELFGQSGGGQGASGLPGTGISAGAAASVFQRALAANAMSPSGASGKSNPITAPNSADVAHAVNVGRVAAASLAFTGSGGGGGGHGSGGSSGPSPSPFSQLQANFLKPTTTVGGGNGPPPSPHRAASSNSVPVSTRSVPGSEVDRLMTHKTSVFSAFKKPPTAAPSVAIPPAFVAPKNTFAPPPMRRPVSETAVSTTTTAAPRAGAVETRAVPPPPPPAQEVAEGQWAEVLYDYSSEDLGDLEIKAGARVFVTDKASEDWWTGQVEGQGREGLFPASYVNLL